MIMMMTKIMVEEMMTKIMVEEMITRIMVGEGVSAFLNPVRATDNI